MVICVAAWLKLPQALLSANDFIGISGYGSGYRLKDLTWKDMEIPLQTLVYELNLFGIDLKKYMQDRPVLYVEQVRPTPAMNTRACTPVLVDTLDWFNLWPPQGSMTLLTTAVHFTGAACIDRSPSKSATLLFQPPALCSACLSCSLLSVSELEVQLTLKLAS